MMMWERKWINFKKKRKISRLIEIKQIIKKGLLPIIFSPFSPFCKLLFQHLLYGNLKQNEVEAIEKERERERKKKGTNFIYGISLNNVYMWERERKKTLMGDIKERVEKNLQQIVIISQKGKRERRQREFYFSIFFKQIWESKERWREKGNK